MQRLPFFQRHFSGILWSSFRRGPGFFGARICLACPFLTLSSLLPSILLAPPPRIQAHVSSGKNNDSVTVTERRITPEQPSWTKEGGVSTDRHTGRKQFNEQEYTDHLTGEKGLAFLGNLCVRSEGEMQTGGPPGSSAHFESFSDSEICLGWSLMVELPGIWQGSPRTLLGAREMAK